MEKQTSRQRAEARMAMRRLQLALRLEMRRKGSVECRYAGGCPVARAGACPGIC